MNNSGDEGGLVRPLLIERVFLLQKTFLYRGGEKMTKRLFTSESVTEGHPDKMCDQISDAILDAMLALDPQSRVACETLVTTGMVVVVGEISTNCYVDIPKIVRKTIEEIGYTGEGHGFAAETCAVLTSIDEQSADIALGVDRALEAKKGERDLFTETGAGDQGMMFGFACDDTPEMMPLPIAMAHRLAKKLSEVRKEKLVDYLRPDGKTQVTVEYEDDKPLRIDTIVISTQHGPEASHEQIEKDLIEYVIKPVVPAHFLDINTKYLINPTGRFVIGGPQGDSGLTGRKIIVDTYGGYARHGGGAFSGKDPTKVDRSAAYAARWVAKNLVAAGVASKLEIEVAYAIGVARPVSIEVDTNGTGKICDDKIVEIINKVFDLRPAAIIKNLNLRRPIYRQTASYGHFGRTDVELPWEELNKVEEIKKAIEELR
jgi:S-adenosylmethionine synthetase